jgi:hypothetical protein
LRSVMRTVLTSSITASTVSPGAMRWGICKSFRLVAGLSDFAGLSLAASAGVAEDRSQTLVRLDISR